MAETNRTGGSDTREPGRPTRPPSHTLSPDVSQPADVSLEARASARRFLERLAARTPETERYEDHGEIARGGMGSIRKVQDQVLRRTLAMKVLLEREPDDDPEAESSAEILLARFLEEAQVTGQLDHPGVVPVHDMGVDEKGRVWFTMRLVKGRNFEEIIELVQKGEDGWTLTRAVQSLQRVCEAMAFAHSKGVVHRDLKPANVMVGRFGETYVMDWGLARVADRPETVEVRVTPHAADSSTVLTARDVAAAAGSSHSPQLTMAGSIVGTPAYMAPEQARGEVDEVDERSDVYAVGSMLYHLLAGHRPYLPPGSKLNAIEVLRALTAGPPARITDRDVPPELLAICDKAMARDKQDRYAGMLALGEDLQAYLEGRVVRAHKTGARAEFAKWVGRNKLAAGALAAATLLTLVGFGSIAWITHAKNKELARARDAALLESYGSNLSTANASLTLSAVEEARRRLEACDPALRGWEWDHLSLAATPLVRRVAIEGVAGAEPDPIERLVWSPDGGRFALRCAKRLEIRDAVLGTKIDELSAASFALRTFAWSPDGRDIALANASNELLVWTPGSGAAPRAIGKHALGIMGLRFSPDGRRLYTTAGNFLAAGPNSAEDRESGRVFAWDLQAGEARFVLGDVGPMIQNIDLDARGTRLLATDREGTLRIWDLERRELVATRRFPGSFVATAAFEGQSVLLCTSSAGLQVWDGRLEQQLASREDPEALAGFLLDWVIGPQHIACRRPDGSLRIFDRHDLSDIATLNAAPEDASTFSFDPSGRWLAGAGKRGQIGVWSPEIARASFDLPLPDWNVTCLAFAPDASTLLVGSSWGRVAVLDSSSGTTLGAQRIPRGAVRALRVSTDGRRAFVVHEKGLHVLHMPDLAPEAVVEGSWRSAAFVGAACVLGGEDGSVAWIDAATRKPTTPIARHAGPVTCVTGSGDGAWAASGAQDGSVIVWDARERTMRRKVSGDGTALTAIAVDPAGRWVAAADARGRLRRWDVASGRLERTAPGREKAAIDLVASPKGERLFTCADDGMLRVWDAERLLEVATLAQTGGRVDHVAVSQDGARIACALDRGTVRVLESRASDLHAPARTEWLATQRRAHGLVTTYARELGSVRAVEERVARDAGITNELRAAMADPLKELREEARSAVRQSWRIVQQKDEGQSAYRAALQQAERAWRLEPEKAANLDTLALAILRAGDAGRAIELLARDAAADGRPAALAIRALSRARLGEPEVARADARRALELLRSTPRDKTQDWTAITKEAATALGLEPK